MKFILGIKENMSQYFSEDGKVYPVTIIKTGKTVVTKVKTKETDGYFAVQIGFGEKKDKNIKKPVKGQLGDFGNFRYLREFRTNKEPGYKEGDSIDFSTLFAEGDKIVVSSISKGKGFQGVVKRHGFHGGSRTHGQKHSEREPGSIGAGGMQRVQKGKRMAGRMWGDRITQKNLKVVSVDKKNSLLFIKGAVAGRKGTLVEIVAK